MLHAKRMATFVADVPHMLSYRMLLIFTLDVCKPRTTEELEGPTFRRNVSTQQFVTRRSW